MFPFMKERIQNFLDLLEGQIEKDRLSIAEISLKKGNFRTAAEADADPQAWRDFRPGDRWGGMEEAERHAWFRMQAVIPEALDGQPVYLHMSTGPSGGWDLPNPQLLVYANGTLMQGLDVRHQRLLLTESGERGAVYQLDVHAYCGIKGGLSELSVWIASEDRTVEQLYYDMKVPFEVVQWNSDGEKEMMEILQVLNETVNRVDTRLVGSGVFRRSAADADQYLQTEFYAKHCRPGEITALCVGHTHIDVAWLWTLAQTREKAARSFSTVLRLMERYPEYVFMSSQPQLYQYVKEDHPELYAQIRERVREGRWIPEGGMWLEADCNLSSGESLVRQLLHGYRFFKEEFGVESEILWLPDVFGYSVALPQIIRKAGLKYFMTTKLSWNETNCIPYDTFLWQGLDGTRVLTHFVTTQSPAFTQTPFATSYNGRLEPAEVIGGWRRYFQKDLHSETLMTFGYGDGGGGPTEQMLENARRMSRGIPGCPTVRIGSPVDFFRRLETSVSGNQNLPVWDGELYLEYHRGTYTSMAKNKRNNRKAEILFQAGEIFGVMANRLTGAEYDAETRRAGWEIILRNQFHDIIPGSAIKAVYEDSDAEYQRAFAMGAALTEKAIDAIAAKVRSEGPSLLVMNDLCTERDTWITFRHAAPVSTLEDSGGARIPCVRCQAAGGDIYGAWIEGIPPMGYRTFRIRTGGGQTMTETRTPPRRLSTEFFEIEFDDSWQIAGLYDRQADREILAPGTAANRLVAYEDRPYQYDAWDINGYYTEKSWPVDNVAGAELIEENSERTVIRIKRRFMRSALTQDIIIYRKHRRIDFETTVDWHENHILLRVLFPTNLVTGRAVYEVQFGNAERPKHRNTSWDAAKFEVCAHKWMDLSEDGYGLSLLNDCKYGHSALQGEIGLTLIKSATDPNPDADQGEHVFTYSLFPHLGGWREAGTLWKAYDLNHPAPVRVLGENPGGSLPPACSFLRVEGENAVAETMKIAEDGSGVIIRLYEAYGRRAGIRLKFCQAPRSARLCDLMEREEAPADLRGNEVRLTARPYELITLKVVF